MNLQDWVLAARPKTLAASIIPVLVGSTLAFKLSGQFNYFIFACTLLGSLFIQVATNYINDAIDFKKGTDTAERLGPKRMTATASYKTLMTGGLICLVLATVCGMPLVLHGGFPILILGMVSALLAYGYTGGPFPLAYLGLGDVFVLLFFGLAAVGGTFYLQVGSLTTSSLVAGTQIGLLSVVLIAINNYRDMDQDVKTKKKTLAVRFGSNFMKTEISFCLLAPFVLCIYWFKYEMKMAALLPFLTLPLALMVLSKISKSRPSVLFNTYLAQAGVLLMGFGLLLTAGIFLS